MFDHPRARRRLGVERLEARDVPAWAVSPLATFAGDVAAPHQPDWVQMQVETSANRALLTFESTPADGSAFEPGRLSLFAGAGAHAGSPGMVGGPGYTLRAVSPGMFFARVAGAAGTTGAFDVAVGLAGDVNGDHQVDGTDLDAIRALRGTRAGQAGFVAAADVNHNGMIGPGDLLLARRNLGISVTAGPLTADQFLFAGSDALGLTRGGGVRAAIPGPQIGLALPGILNGTPMELGSFSWAVSHQPNGVPVASDLAVTKKTDAASPKLFLACATGQHFPDATLTVRRAGPLSPVILRWDLTDVLISSYQISGAHGGTGPSLEEAMTLNFGKITFTYTPILPTGRLGDPVVTEFDFRTGGVG